MAGMGLVVLPDVHRQLPNSCDFEIKPRDVAMADDKT